MKLADVSCTLWQFQVAMENQHSENSCFLDEEVHHPRPQPEAAHHMRGVPNVFANYRSSRLTRTFFMINLALSILCCQVPGEMTSAL